jgi:hypothetical protein
VTLLFTKSCSLALQSDALTLDKGNLESTFLHEILLLKRGDHGEPAGVKQVLSIKIFLSIADCPNGNCTPMSGLGIHRIKSFQPVTWLFNQSCTLALEGDVLALGE